jgi:hypothetical protein
MHISWSSGGRTVPSRAGEVRALIESSAARRPSGYESLESPKKVTWKLWPRVADSGTGVYEISGAALARRANGKSQALYRNQGAIERGLHG